MRPGVGEYTYMYSICYPEIWHLFTVVYVRFLCNNSLVFIVEIMQCFIANCKWAICTARLWKCKKLPVKKVDMVI